MEIRPLMYITEQCAARIKERIAGVIAKHLAKVGFKLR
jgi:hypothetical protein